MKGKSEELEFLFRPYQPVEKLPYSLTCGNISIVSPEKGVETLPCRASCMPASSLTELLGGDEGKGADRCYEVVAGVGAGYLYFGIRRGE